MSVLHLDHPVPTRQRRSRPEQVQLSGCRIEHLTITIAVEPAALAEGTATPNGQIFHGIDTLRAALAEAKDASLNRERGKLVEAIARRGNGAGA